jgi:hypothetical protein
VYYLVTMKNPGRTPKYHEKEIGPCRTSPVCTDAEGAHHSFVAEAPNAEVIFATALKEGMHITRVEEVYHVRKYEAANVSVRADDDWRPVPEPGQLTRFDLGAEPGFADIDRVASSEERIYLSEPKPGSLAGRTGRGSVPEIVELPDPDDAIEQELRAAVPGWDALPDAARSAAIRARVEYNRINDQFALDLDAALAGTSSYTIDKDYTERLIDAVADDGRGGDGEVSGADGEGLEEAFEGAELAYRISPDGDGIIRN